MARQFGSWDAVPGTGAATIPSGGSVTIPGDDMKITTPPNPHRRGSLDYALWAMFTSGFALGRQTTGDLDTDQAFTLMCRALADSPGTVTRAEP